MFRTLIPDSAVAAAAIATAVIAATTAGACTEKSTEPGDGVDTRYGGGGATAVTNTSGTSTTSLGGGGSAGGVSAVGGTNAGGAAGERPSLVGDPCEDASDCPSGGSGTAACLTDWPAGYCAIEDCAPHAHDCPDDPGLGSTASTGSGCVQSPEPTCLALCGDRADCRDGYDCVALPDAADDIPTYVCMPTG